MVSVETSTKETQELIYKRRVQRMQVTKGVSRGKLIDRVNAISKKKYLPKKRESPPKVTSPQSP